MEIKKVLIANRGEIAIRVIRTCKELGIETVSIHSTIDENSLHVKMADESVCIGPAQAVKSYLNPQAILSAVEITGADAIHPGYGFLSENPEFAKMCDDCSLNFIGPKPEIIKSMGSKIKSKEIARNAGVATLESIILDGLSHEEIIEKISDLGLPVLIKASSGGGGRGMEVIRDLGKLDKKIEKLQSEALSFFGDGTLFIEKFIERPRHIEVQIAGDNFGNIIHLGERDCTIQRNYQKVLEESPSMVLSTKLREEICQSAIKIAEAVNYNSVGTVEFLFDLDSKKFYFIEMNTRIQVEHPVTEMVTGVDLIELQLMIAQNKKIKFKQNDIKFSGHAIECRINAEDPKTFLPSPGQIDHYHRPGGLGVRVDDYIYTGYKVSPFYDSMVSKVICHDQTRDRCISRMKRAINETIIGGISTNLEMHTVILNNENFLSNQYSTNFLKNL